jgi:hypothetical protein
VHWGVISDAGDALNPRAAGGLFASGSTTTSAARPAPEVVGTLVEILNDSASALLRQESEDGSRRALALLDEAEAHVERGEYGWTEIHFNRAEALRLLGRLDEAEAILRDQVEFSERAYGDPSLQLFAALANLAEVYRRGKPGLRRDLPRGRRRAAGRTRSRRPRPNGDEDERGGA